MYKLFTDIKDNLDCVRNILNEDFSGSEEERQEILDYLYDIETLADEGLNALPELQMTGGFNNEFQ